MSKLYVFEGPDNVGKTALSEMVGLELRARGCPCERLAFPGAKPGSIGSLVRGAHDLAEKDGLSQTALQLLHVAAHVDLIERRIRPLLSNGVNVLLDRYWWSTVVYGRLAGVSGSQLDSMLEVEMASWGGVVAERIFLVERDAPEVDVQLVKAYADLLVTESHGNLTRISNNRTLEEAAAEIVKVIEASCDKKKDAPGGALKRTFSR